MKVRHQEWQLTLAQPYHGFRLWTIIFEFSLVRLSLISKLLLLKWPKLEKLKGYWRHSILHKSRTPPSCEEHYKIILCHLNSLWPWANAGFAFLLLLLSWLLFYLQSLSIMPCRHYCLKPLFQLKHFSWLMMSDRGEGDQCQVRSLSGRAVIRLFSLGHKQNQCY